MTSRAYSDRIPKSLIFRPSADIELNVEFCLIWDLSLLAKCKCNFGNGMFNLLEKDKKNKKEGVVTESLPDTTFKVRLEDGREVLAYLSGKMRLNYIKVMLGDRVTVELGGDEKRGRIVFRN